MKIECGQKFKLTGSSLYNGDVYILAKIKANEFALISLVNGNRWTDPIEILGYVTCIEIPDTSELWGNIGRDGWEIVKDFGFVSGFKLEEPNNKKGENKCKRMIQI